MPRLAVRTPYRSIWTGYAIAALLLIALILFFVPASEWHEAGHTYPLAVLAIFAGYILGSGPVINWAFRQLIKKGSK